MLSSLEGSSISSNNFAISISTSKLPSCFSTIKLDITSFKLLSMFSSFNAFKSDVLSVHNVKLASDSISFNITFTLVLPNLYPSSNLLNVALIHMNIVLSSLSVVFSIFLLAIITFV